jgi:hypothetical protein
LLQIKICFIFATLVCSNHSNIFILIIVTMLIFLYKLYNLSFYFILPRNIDKTWAINFS